MSKYPFLTIVVTLFACNAVFAQDKSDNTPTSIPTGYYDNAYTSGTPKTCATLKTALFNIISTGTTAVTYTPGVWNAYKTTDLRRNDGNTADIIWDMYSDNPSGADPYTFTYSTDQCGTYSKEGDCYNREHTFPQSWFNSASPMVTDLHHLFPTDGYVNGKRSDNPFGKVNTVSWTSQNGSKLGTSSYAGFTGTVFEPIDEYKGDIARAMFYMVTRYESQVAGWQNNANADDILNGTTWPALDPWAIQLWYQWHTQDPVSAKEIARNDAIYAIQKNRNPYIDHPEFVGLVWQCTGLVPVTLSSFTAQQEKDKNDIKINWILETNQNIRKYNIEKSTDGIHFTVLGSVLNTTATQYSYTDNTANSSTKVFYRIMLEYTDGKKDFSKIIVVNNVIDESTVVFPNPARDKVEISFKNINTKDLHIKIYDISGRLFLSQDFFNASSRVTINTTTLQAGKYFLSISTNDQVLHNTIEIIR